MENIILKSIFEIYIYIIKYNSSLGSPALSQNIMKLCPYTLLCTNCNKIFLKIRRNMMENIICAITKNVSY